MIFNLNELAIEFRKAWMNELTFDQSFVFLNEIQRVYSMLHPDDQEDAQELWVGFSRGELVVDSYHFDNFFPILNLKDYLIELDEEYDDQVEDFLDAVGGSCYANKMWFDIDL